MAYERVPPNKKDCEDNQIPIAWRDYCAHKLIPLNKCRFKNFFLPWTCEHERHEFEKCQYNEFRLRLQKMKE